MGGRERPLPDGAWLILRTGWGERGTDPVRFANADADGPHTPGVSAAAAKWLAEQSPITGLGGRDGRHRRGHRGRLRADVPGALLPARNDKYGLTQLRGVDKLPTLGAVLVASPLPIVGGTGSPARVFALVERA